MTRSNRQGKLDTSPPEIGPFQIMGRAPPQMVITPSNQGPWIGWLDAGERFTRPQLYYLRHRGFDPATVEWIMVRRCATHREMYIPAGAPTPAFEFECPIILRRADGRLNVLSPSGESKIVLADGWVSHPKPDRYSRGPGR